MGGTLYIDRKEAELRLDGRAVALYVNGRRDGTVPLVPLDRLILIGTMTVQTNVLHRLSEEGIAVLLLSGKQQAFRGRLVGRQHHHAKLRIRQYHRSGSMFGRIMAQEWVVRKLKGQERVLRMLGETRHDVRPQLWHAADTIQGILRQLEEPQSIERLRGLEGAAAAAYFSAFPMVFPPSLTFMKRTRRPPADPVNALLSLTYTMLHWEWVRECEVIGLDPAIGFYHEVDYGRESLACDLTEPDRPAVDEWVWELFRSRTFTDRDFSADGERPGCYLKKPARGRFYAAYEAWMSTRRSAMRREVEVLARRILDGENPLPLGMPDASCTS